MSLLSPLVLVLSHLFMVNSSVVIMHPGDQLIETVNPLLVSFKLSLSQGNLSLQRKFSAIVIYLNRDEQAPLITDLKILVGDQLNEEIIDLSEDEEVKLFLKSIISQLDFIDESLGEVSDVEDDRVATVTQLALETTSSEAGYLTLIDGTFTLHFGVTSIDYKMRQLIWINLEWYQN